MPQIPCLVQDNLTYYWHNNSQPYHIALLQDYDNYEGKK